MLTAEVYSGSARINIDNVTPFLRGISRDGKVISQLLNFKEIVSEKYKGIATPQDVELASQMIGRESRIGHMRCIRNLSSAACKKLIGMPNLVMKTTDQDGKVVDSRPITVRQGVCEMSMSVAENGDTVLRVPWWVNGLHSTENANELEYIEVDPVISD